jgi:hypothetical protein
VGAVAIAFLYSLHIVSRHGVPAPCLPPQPGLDFVVVDALIGLAGAACLHSPRFRAAVGAGLRRLSTDGQPGAPHG